MQWLGPEIVSLGEGQPALFNEISESKQNQGVRGGKTDIRQNKKQKETKKQNEKRKKIDRQERGQNKCLYSNKQKAKQARGGKLRLEIRHTNKSEKKKT